MSNNPGCPKDLEDAFVNVMFQEERNGETVNKGNDSFYDKLLKRVRDPRCIRSIRVNNQDISFGPVR